MLVRGLAVELHHVPPERRRATRRRDGPDSLERRAAVPGVEDVLGSHLVTVRERDVVAKLERVGQPIRGRSGHLGRDVRNDVQVVVEPEQSVEHVLSDLGVRLGIDHPDVQRAEVADDRELQGLVRGQASASPCSRTAGGQRYDRRHGRTQGLEEPNRSWRHSFPLFKKLRRGLNPRHLPGSQPGRERADGGWRPCAALFTLLHYYF